MANETMAITIESFMRSGISLNDAPCGARKLNTKYNVNNESIQIQVSTKWPDCNIFIRKKLILPAADGLYNSNLVSTIELK